MDIKKLFDSLGLNGTWWQWRVHRFKQRFARQKDAFDSGQASQNLNRSVRNLIPRSDFVSSLLLTAILAYAVIGALLFGMAEALNPGTEFLWRMGALVPLRVFEAGEYWRILTYGYLHIGLIHLLFNGIALFQVGPVLERELGSSRFFTAYTVSLAGGAFADLWIRDNPLTTIAGASGGLFGLIGLGISYCHFYGRALHLHRDFFLRWALYSFLFGFFVGADNVAHAGGLFAGALMGFILERERRFRPRLDALWTFLALSCLAATAWAFISLATARPADADFVSDMEHEGIHPADEVTGVEILAWGPHEPIQRVGETPAPDTVQGSVHQMAARDQVAFKDPRGSRVVGKVGEAFGVLFKTHGTPQGSIADLEVRVLHPPLTNPKTGVRSERESWGAAANIGMARFTGWSFDEPWEIAPGKWTIQILSEGRRMAEKEFEVLAD